MSPDPIGGAIASPQSLNRYAYVVNNPTNFVDPLGLWCLPVVDGVLYCEVDQGGGGGTGPGMGGGGMGSNDNGCPPTFVAGRIGGLFMGPGPCGGRGGGGGGGTGGGTKQRPQTQGSATCTALQRAAGLAAAQLKRNGESLGLVALGGGVVSALLTGGEEFTAGLDTPLTLTAYHATGSFAALSILDFAASAALESYASGGNPSALENFAWDQFASLAGGFAAGASKIPFVSRFAEPLGDLAGEVAALANQAEGGCR